MLKRNLILHAICDLYVTRRNRTQHQLQRDPSTTLTDRIIHATIPANASA